MFYRSIKHIIVAWSVALTLVQLVTLAQAEISGIPNYAKYVEQIMNDMEAELPPSFVLVG